MTAIVDKYVIKDKTLDKRVKLTPTQREEIATNKQGLSQRKLAAEYGVSRRTIQFILDPEKHKQNLLRRKERGGTMVYYDKKKNSAAIKKHRAYKKQLLKDNLLTKIEDDKASV